jgi:preprotein translocase subunit SecG
VGVVLLQRSEGGGLGIGGGSGFMSARGAANTLTRTTGFLAAGFFATSLALSLLARYGGNPTDILDRLPEIQQQQEGGNGVLDAIGGAPVVPVAPAQPEVPAGDGDLPVPSLIAPPAETQTEAPGNGAAIAPAIDTAPAAETPVTPPAKP